MNCSIRHDAGKWIAQRWEVRGKKVGGRGFTSMGRGFNSGLKKNYWHLLQMRIKKGFQEVKVPRFRDNGPGWW